jgi:hypothetical protein
METLSGGTKLTGTGMGAAFGTAKAGIGIAGIGTYRPDLIMKVPWTPNICMV